MRTREHGEVVSSTASSWVLGHLVWIRDPPNARAVCPAHSQCSRERVYLSTRFTCQFTRFPGDRCSVVVGVIDCPKRGVERVILLSTDVQV